jgi:hypothetical protein
MKQRNPTYVMGMIARAMFLDDDIPTALLNTLLTRPASALAELTKRKDWVDRQEHIAPLVALLPADLADPKSGIKVEDQGPFWLGYYQYQRAISRADQYGADDLAHIGKLLYGDNHWQAGLARDLDVDPRRIRQWLSQERPIPTTIWLDLNHMLTRRQIAIDDALKCLA